MVFDPDKYTVGWICAISTEFTAARTFFDEEHEGPGEVAQHDNNSYALGRIGKHNVVMAVMPDGDYGTTSAATVGRDMLHTFRNVRIGLMVGIAGGAPSQHHDIRLGDVVVGSRGGGYAGVFQFDYGKNIQGQPFSTTQILNQPPPSLLTAVAGLKADDELAGAQLDEKVDKSLRNWPRLKGKYSRPLASTDQLYQPHILHPDPSLPCDQVCGSDPRNLVARGDREMDQDKTIIHHGPIASSNSLMKNAKVRDQLATQNGVLCFEMEAAGLVNHFPCLVIRGICDYCDTHKNKSWQGYAAMAAAAYARDLLYKIAPNKVEGEKRLAEALVPLNKSVDALVSKQRDESFKRRLSPPDASASAVNANNVRQKGTGQWLLESPEFREWDIGKRQYLWLHGFVGCGKTVLCSTILEHIGQRKSQTTLRFFFDSRDEDPSKRTLDSMVRGLLYELYQVRSSFSGELDQFDALFNDERHQLDTNNVSQYLWLMLSRANKVCIVIDGLDECSTTEALLTWMETTVNLRNVKLIAASRETSEFDTRIPGMIGKNNCIKLKKEAINADIRSYIRSRILRWGKLDKWSKEVLHQIEESVGSKANGMFRWVACQLDTLERSCSSEAEVYKALESLPKDLDETYERMMKAIPRENEAKAIRLLQFLVFSQRPLTVAEAIDVVAEVPNKRHRYKSQSDLVRLCPSFLTIVELDTSTGLERQVHLAHFSVKEYLWKHQDALKKEKAFHTIVSTCLAYLEFIHPYDLTQIMSLYPLARFAAHLWPDYARQLDGAADIVAKAVNFMQNRELFMFWTKFYGERNASPLYFACLRNLPSIAKVLLARKRDLHVLEGSYSSALQAAAAHGCREIIAFLFSEGANIHAQLEGGAYGCGNALQAAARNGHTETVRLLLDYGVDVDALSGGPSTYESALQAAARGGSVSTVELLLDRKALVNLEGGRYGTALRAAACWRHRDVVDLLLRRGADPNLQGGISGNALTSLIAGPSLAQQAQVATQNGSPANPLLWNSNQDRLIARVSPNSGLEIMQMLLQHKVDTNTLSSECGPPMTALQIASVRNYQSVVQILASVATTNAGTFNVRVTTTVEATTNAPHVASSSGPQVYAQQGTLAPQSTGQPVTIVAPLPMQQSTLPMKKTAQTTNPTVPIRPNLTGSQQTWASVASVPPGPFPFNGIARPNNPGSERNQAQQMPGIHRVAQSTRPSFAHMQQPQALQASSSIQAQTTRRVNQGFQTNAVRQNIPPQQQVPRAIQRDVAGSRQPQPNQAPQPTWASATRGGNQFPQSSLPRHQISQGQPSQPAHPAGQIPPAAQGPSATHNSQVSQMPRPHMAFQPVQDGCQWHRTQSMPQVQKPPHPPLPLQPPHQAQSRRVHQQQQRTGVPQTSGAAQVSRPAIAGLNQRLISPQNMLAPQRT